MEHSGPHMNGDDGFVLVEGIAGTGNRILAFLSGLLSPD